MLVGFTGAGLDGGQIRLRCFDAMTGELVWTRTGPFTGLSGNDMGAGLIRGDADVVVVRGWAEVLDLASGDALAGVASEGMGLFGDGLAVRVGGAGEAVASDLRSGAERWARPIPEGMVVVEAGAGLLIADQADRLGPLVAFDLRTGEERWTLPDRQRGVTYGAVPRGGVVYVLSLFEPGTDLTAVDARTGEQLAQVRIAGVPSLDGPNLHADVEGLVLVNNRGAWLPVTWEPAG